MTAIIDLKTNIIPSEHFVKIYKIYELSAEKQGEQIDLGKTFVYFELLNNLELKLNSIFEPTKQARDWFKKNKDRLSKLPDGLKATKHIHTYPQFHIFDITHIADLSKVIETITKTNEFKQILKDHISFIKNKISMRLFHEFKINIV